VSYSKSVAFDGHGLVYLEAEDLCLLVRESTYQPVGNNCSVFFFRELVVRRCEFMIKTVQMLFRSNVVCAFVDLPFQVFVSYFNLQRAPFFRASGHLLLPFEVVSQSCVLLCFHAWIIFVLMGGVEEFLSLRYWVYTLLCLLLCLSFLLRFAEQWQAWGSRSNSLRTA
jgi:hypothetical protein